MRKLTLEEVHRYSEELRNWNRWGKDDEIGTLNFVTPEKIVEAAKLIIKGEIFALAIDFDANGPQTGGLGRFNPTSLCSTTKEGLLLLFRFLSRRSRASSRWLREPA